MRLALRATRYASRSGAPQSLASPDGERSGRGPSRVSSGSTQWTSECGTERVRVLCAPREACILRPARVDPARPSIPPPEQHPGHAGLVREFVLALGIVLLFVVAFLEKPLSHFATHQYTSADLGQDFALTRVEPSHAPQNQLLSDPAVEMLPWLLHAREELGEGRLPLWNERNGCGVPHFANAQSAVLSPFSLPFYVLPLKVALLVAAAAKLFLAAAFTWLFLRRIGLAFWPAFLGATSFTWCGHNVTLLAYPHTSAMVALPAGLYFAEVACARLWHGLPGRATALLGLALSLTGGALAGQPEPFFFCAIGVGLWTAFRVYELARVQGGSDRWRRAFVCAAWLGGSALAAAAIAAVQMLPFLEYLRNSRALLLRDAPQAPLSGALWPFLAFPNLLGNPAKLAAGWPDGPAPNFEFVHAVTTSAFVVFLGLVSLFWIRRSRAHAFFALVMLWWVVYAYDLFGFGRAVGALPIFGIAPMNRSQPLGVFALCACAAFGLERIAELRGRARIVGGVVLLALGAAAAWYAASEANLRLDRYLARNAAPDDFSRYARDHVRVMLGLFGVGVLLLVVKPWLRPRTAGWTVGATIVVIAFVPWGWMLRNYNPTVPDRVVYPRTEAIDRLRMLVRDERLLVFGEDVLPPDMNLVHGLDVPASYDALGIARYDELWREHFGRGGNWSIARAGTLNGLALLGVRFVLTRGSFLPVESTFGGFPPLERDRFRAGPVVPGRAISQTFTASDDGLQGLRVELATDGRANRCTLWLALEDLERGTLVDLQSLDASILRADETERCELVFRFDPIRDSKGRRFRFTLSSPDATGSQCVLALGRRDFGQVERHALVDRPGAPLTEYVPGELYSGDERVQGGLVLDLSYRRELFRRVTEFAGFTLWKYEDGRGPFSFATRALPARDLDESLALTKARGFDPRRDVILPADAARANPLSDGALPEAEVAPVEQTSTRSRVLVRSSTPGWLVASQPFYPGWQARVNGVERPLLRANHAFCAVELPAGASEVEFVYEPGSFRRGIQVSCAGWMILVVGFFSLRRRERAERSSKSPR